MLVDLLKFCLQISFLLNPFEIVIEILSPQEKKKQAHTYTYTTPLGLPVANYHIIYILMLLNSMQIPASTQ